jgi:Rod binding domain-containing protein
MTSLPPIDQSMLPADIRRGSDDDRQRYAVALGFERTLVNELAKTMAETAKPDGEGESKDAATSMYLDMLPERLADSVTQNGGLGLARNLYESMKASGQ